MVLFSGPTRESVFDILGISRNATEREIDKAFAKKAMLYHPDKNPEGAEMYKKINEAHYKIKEMLGSDGEIFDSSDFEDSSNDSEMLLKLSGKRPRSDIYREKFQNHCDDYSKGQAIYNYCFNLEEKLFPLKTTNITSDNAYLKRINAASDINCFLKEYTGDITKLGLFKDFKQQLIPVKEFQVNAELYDTSRRYKLYTFQPAPDYTPFKFISYIEPHFSNGKILYPIEKPSRLNSLPAFSVTSVNTFKPIRSTRTDVCSDCGISFGLFTWKWMCDICGEHQCNNCQTKESALHLGLIDKVDICNKCMKEKKIKEFDLWSQSIPSGQDQARLHLSCMGTLFSNLKTNFVYLGAKLINNNPTLGMQCYYYAKIRWTDFNKVISLLFRKSYYDVYGFIKTFGFEIQALEEAKNWINSGNSNLVQLALKIFVDTKKENLILELLDSNQSNSIKELAIQFITTDRFSLCKKYIRINNDLGILLLRYDSSSLMKKLSLLELKDLPNEKAMSFAYKILYELKELIIKNKEKGLEGFWLYLFWLIITKDPKEWIKCINIKTGTNIQSLSFLVHVFNDWKTMSKEYLSTGYPESAIICYKLYEMKSTVPVDWEQFALDCAPLNFQLACSIYYFSMRHLDLINANCALKLAAVLYAQTNLSEDRLLIIFKAYERTKDIKLIYSALKTFGPENVDAKIKQFHQIILEAEKDPEILCRVLEYSYNKIIADRLEQEIYTPWRLYLTNILEKRDLKELTGVKIKSMLIDSSILVLEIFYNNAFSQDQFSKILYLILKSKIETEKGNLMEGLHLLQETLLLTQDEAVFAAIDTVEASILDRFGANFYVKRDLTQHIKRFPNRIKPTRINRIIEKCEAQVLEKNDAFMKGMDLIDLSAAVSHPLLVLNCLLNSCLFLFQSYPTLPEKHYACLKIVCELLQTCWYIARSNLDPFGRKYVNTIVLDMLYELAKYSLIDSNFKDIVDEIVSSYGTQCILIPFNAPLMQCLDLLYVDIVNIEYLIYKLRKKSNDSELFQYYLYEAYWLNWIRDNDEEQYDKEMNEERIKCMVKLDYENSVEEIMNWPIVERNNGWITGNLNLIGETFGDVTGFVVNMKYGSLSIFKKGTGLCTYSDLYQVLGLGISNSFFTLEQPDTKYHYNPYQKMRYFPECISGTDYLGTLFHADYLLKMLSTGYETNGNFPFNRRPFNTGLAYDLKISSHSLGTAHRFWIEFQSVDYKIMEKDKEITVLFGKIKVQVKKHLLKLDKNGKLVDDDNDSDYFINENGVRQETSEARFARLMTENYDSISSRYKIFARLKLLAKLGVISLILKGKYGRLFIIANVYPTFNNSCVMNDPLNNRY